MPDVTIYTTRGCAFCHGAKQLLGSLGIDFEEHTLDGRTELRRELARANNWRTVPMIFIKGEFVGGFTDVLDLHRDGELEKLLGATGVVCG